jgi:ribulose-5-phosphate 4-epimerase/fuculose-1-phosphate aldolase
MRDPDPRHEIVQASQILFANGVVDAFGHVSQRNPDRPQTFLMSRSKAPALVSLDDVLEVDLGGEPLCEPGARLFLERFIHTEIYRRHPDVNAVVHSHAVAVLPFTVVASVPLRPVSHMCGFLRGLKAPFDIAKCAGDGSDLLIRSPELGRALAEHLDEAKVALMRGHGFTTVGGSIQEAVFNAVYTQFNARVLLDALRLGTPHYLSAAEAQACETTTLTQASRAWDLWVRRSAPDVL